MDLGTRGSQVNGVWFFNPVLDVSSSCIRGHRAESIITNSADGDRDRSRPTDKNEWHPKQHKKTARVAVSSLFFSF